MLYSAIDGISDGASEVGDRSCEALSNTMTSVNTTTATSILKGPTQTRHMSVSFREDILVHQPAGQDPGVANCALKEPYRVIEFSL